MTDLLAKLRRKIGLNTGHERRRCFVCNTFGRIEDMRRFARGLWSCTDKERCAERRTLMVAILEAPNE